MALDERGFSEEFNRVATRPMTYLGLFCFLMFMQYSTSQWTRGELGSFQEPLGFPMSQHHQTEAQTVAKLELSSES